MSGEQSEYGLEFLLAFDGRIHHLEEGYWIKFEIKRFEAAKERPHGLSYSFTLHGPDGTRLLGFDNAHGVAAAAVPAPIILLNVRRSMTVLPCCLIRCGVQ